MIIPKALPGIDMEENVYSSGQSDIKLEAP